MRRLGALGDGNQDNSKPFQFPFNFIDQCVSQSFLCEILFLGVVVRGNPSNLVLVHTSISGTLSADEWEAAYLYMSFVLRKVSSKHLSCLLERKTSILLYLPERKCDN